MKHECWIRWYLCNTCLPIYSWDFSRIDSARFVWNKSMQHQNHHAGARVLSRSAGVVLAIPVRLLVWYFSPIIKSNFSMVIKKRLVSDKEADRKSSRANKVLSTLSFSGPQAYYRLRYGSSKIYCRYGWYGQNKFGKQLMGRILWRLLARLGSEESKRDAARAQRQTHL